MPALCTSTGHEQADRILQGIIGMYEEAFPGRIRSYLVHGSYADGIPLPRSDLDVAVIFRDRLSPEESDRAQRLWHSCELLSPIRVDVGSWSESELSSELATLLKVASIHVYGEDVRMDLQLPPIAVHKRHAIQYPTWAAHGLRHAEVLHYPLDYPDPDSEFYGYDQIGKAHWYPPGTTQGLKGLWYTVVGNAVGIIALEAEEYVLGARNTVRSYAELIGDEWTEHIKTVFETCKGKWHDLVPQDPEDRKVLRELCRRTLGFENRFFATYRDYLLGVLQSAEDDDRSFATEQLRRIIYPDEEVASALPELRV